MRKRNGLPTTSGPNNEISYKRMYGDPPRRGLLGEVGRTSRPAPSFRHPCLVVQNNLFNTSRIHTVVVCALTSNLQRAEAPGNVLLSKGEAGLPKKSVVNISQIHTVNKEDLAEKSGRVSEKRLALVLEGVQMLFQPRNV